MTNRMTCPPRTKHSPPRRCAPVAEHPGRWCAGRNDEGTIGILTLGFGVLVLMVVLVVASATAVHVAHLRAAHLADELAVQGADALSSGSYFTGGGLDSVRLSRQEVERVMGAHHDRRDTGTLAGARVTGLDIADDATVTVTVELTVYPLFGLEALVPYADGITLTATSSSRAS